MQRNKTVLIFFLLTVNSVAQIVLSEIMFNPAGNERHDEYIELYNVGTESVDLAGWLLSDGTKFNTILAFQDSSLLLPGHYALLLVPKYFEESNSYENEIPEETLILTIDKSQFGAYGLKNSEGEPVSIHQQDTTLIASYQYTPENEDGFSEEKIDLDKGDVEGNWTNSTKKGGTPGYENSVTPQPHDLGLTAFTFWPEHPSTKDSIHLQFVIKNFGTFSVKECTIIVQDSTDAFVNVLVQKRCNLNGLAPKDSMQIVLSFLFETSGHHVLIATIDFPDDGQLLNNMARVEFDVSETYPAGSVVINEIMYDTDEKAEEWLELYNASHIDIDLKNWSLRDKRKNMILTGESFILKTGHYCVLTNTEIPDCKSCQQLVTAQLPELNNTGDELVLADAVGIIIDSVSYNRSFGGGRFISLERIRVEDGSCRSDNWNSSKAESGSTPGQLNSISPKEYDAALEEDLLIEPKHPAAGDDVLLSFHISNPGRRAVQDISLTVSFHPISKIERIPIGETLVENINEREVAIAALTWHDIPSGVHVIYAEIKMPMDMVADNNTIMDTIVVSYEPESVVINEIMYSPAEENCEWVEIVNNSPTAIELMNWTISDSDTSEHIQIVNNSYLLECNEFIVIGQDSSILTENLKHGIICPRFPSLSNDRDQIVLYAGHKQPIDRVEYTSDWGGARGRSLERINPNSDSNEPTNWTTCVKPQGHSAGTMNSVFSKSLPPTTSLSISPDPFSPDGDGVDDFVGISYSLSGTVAHVNLKIFDIKGRLVRFLLNNSPSGAERTVYWDGLNDAGIRCRMGIYIIFFQALNESKMCIEQTKKTVVLAGVL